MNATPPDGDCRWVRRGLFAVMGIVASGLAQAQDARFVLSFGAEAAAPIPHAYRYSKLPTDQNPLLMRVPVVEKALASVFPDTELSIDPATEIVQRIHAERAYLSLNDCNTARQIVESKLAELMPAPHDDPLWQHQSADGKAVGGVTCRVERYLPYPVLIFDMSAAPLAR